MAPRKGWLVSVDDAFDGTGEGDSPTAAGAASFGVPGGTVEEDETGRRYAATPARTGALAAPPEGCRRERSRALQDNLTSEHEVVQAAVSSGPQSKHRPRTKDVDDGIAGGAASQCPQEW